MKKNYLKLSGLSLAIALLISSCMPEGETPMTSEAAKLANEVADAGNHEIGGENFRKGPNGVFYQEKFSNQIIQFGDLENGWEEGDLFPAWYPGTGVGNSTFLGKSYSFVNQYASFNSEIGFPVTVGASINQFQFIVDQMKVLGVNDVPDQVHSLTTDGKGNTIYFANILNITTPVSSTRTNFIAKVKIIGGTGKFEAAKGEGDVVGYFNPLSGKGETTLRANIEF